MAFTSNTTTFFTGTGAISASSLRNTFKGTTSGEIKWSELKRKTTDTTAAPFIYDATENAAVPTTNSNISASKYRGTINKVVVAQSGTDIGVTVSTLSQWNSNYNKVVPKELQVTGTIGSNSTGTPAISSGGDTISGKVNVVVSGSILAAGGTGGGAGSAGNPGGDAILISVVNYTVSGGGVIRGGGGGGSGGNTGQPGNTGGQGQTGQPGGTGATGAAGTGATGGGTGNPGATGGQGNPGNANSLTRPSVTTQRWSGAGRFQNQCSRRIGGAQNSGSRTAFGPGGARGNGGPGGARGNNSTC